ncbi:hypothetical protein CRG98_043306 [Punica granatum]|uniref:Uncharacterized protein n=1 Tax=Punica granatum TaxID=22663 RepID=A0A2I0HXN2_PUNGR|nr:hypothetical protein CRG98_043306 [Punica granatum]
MSSSYKGRFTVSPLGGRFVGSLSCGEVRRISSMWGVSLGPPLMGGGSLSHLHIGRFAGSPLGEGGLPNLPLEVKFTQPPDFLARNCSTLTSLLVP